MGTANISLLLLLLAASGSAQNDPPLPQGATALDDGACVLQALTITCACRPGQEVLSLTAASMAGSGGAEALEVSGCPSVSLAFPPLQRLHTLRVKHCGRATFQEKASPLLRHLVLANVSQLALQGPIFQGGGLETVFLDDVRVKTLPSGALANLNNIQNVTFRGVHFSAIEQGAVELQMFNNSELTILNSNLLGIEKSGIVVRGVTNFTMRESKLTTLADDGLQLDAAGPVSISASQLQSAGSVKLSVAAGARFTFVDNVWRNSSLLDLAQQFLFSNVKVTLAGNTFHCTCDPTLEALVGLPEAASLLESNSCDEGLCGAAVPMRVLTSCSNQTELQAACKALLHPGAATVPVTASTSASVTGSPRAAKPASRGANNTATAVAFSLTTALLLTIPAAAARAL